MHFFNSGLFWFLEGVLACLAAAGFKVWMEDRGVPLPFWKWILAGGWALLLGFTVAFVGTSLGEGEPAAALYGGIIFGLATVASGVGLWRLLGKGRKA